MFRYSYLFFAIRTGDTLTERQGELSRIPGSLAWAAMSAWRCQQLWKVEGKDQLGDSTKILRCLVEVILCSYTSYDVVQRLCVN